MWKPSVHLPWIGFEPTTSWSTICFLPVRLHRTLPIWKRLISGNEVRLDSQTIWRSFPVINISKSYMFIQDSSACNATSQQLMRCKSVRRSWSQVFCQQRRWWSSSWQLDDHYINTFWRTVTAYIDRVIDSKNSTEIPNNLLLHK